MRKTQSKVGFIKKKGTYKDPPRKTQTYTNGIYVW